MRRPCRPSTFYNWTQEG